MARHRDPDTRRMALTALLLCSVAMRLAAAAAGSRRMLLQAPGAFGDNNAYNAYYGDPWGTSSGYYDPYGPGYIPGFINVDISKEYGAHFDFGKVAVDLTEDFAGFALGSALGAGVARDGRGYNLQVGNGNVMDLSVTKDSGFGLWLLNGLVNINIGPDGRWNMAAATSPSPPVFGVASAGQNPGSGPVTVQGVAERPPGGGQQQGQTGVAAASVDQQQQQQYAAPQYAAQQLQVQVQPPQQQVAQQQQQAPLLPSGRRACEGGTVVRVIDNGNGGKKYTCKYSRGGTPAVPNTRRL